MKKIVICVADEIVPTIVSLVMDHAAELHVTSVESSAPSAAPVREMKRTKRSQPEDTRVGRIVMGALPESGERVLVASLADPLAAAGFSPNSITPMISKLVARRLVFRHGKDHIARAPAQSELAV